MMDGSLMPCREAREILAPLRQPVLVAGRVEQARLHVTECLDCQEFLYAESASGPMYAGLARPNAPIGLHHRVASAIANESASQATREDAKRVSFHRCSVPSLTSGRWRVVAVALLALGVGTLMGRAAPPDPPAAGAEFVDDYLRRAVGQERIETSDPARVGQWLMRELGLSMRPIGGYGLELEAAEICLLNGQRGAMIQYRLAGVRVSHYLVPRRGAPQRAPSVGRGGRITEGDMPPLVTWSTHSVEQALVGDMEPERLLSLAQAAF